MSLMLAVETSSIVYVVALYDGNLQRSKRALRRDSEGFRGVAAVVSAAVEEAGVQFANIEMLAVNAGPGNLASIRAGLAYVNGLAFSIGKPIFPANSLELLAHEVGGDVGHPVLALRNAGSGHVYAGLFARGEPGRFGHGPLQQTIARLAEGLTEVAVAGTFRSEAVAVLQQRLSTKDTGVEYSDIETLHGLAVARRKSALVDVASPITDSSAIFR